MRTRLSAALIAMALIAAVFTPSPAHAATTSIPLTLSGTSTKTIPIDTGVKVALDPATQVVVNTACLLISGCPDLVLWYVGVDVLDVDIHLTLNEAVNIDATYTDGILVEGEEVDVVHTFDPTAITSTVTVDVNIQAGSYYDGDVFDSNPPAPYEVASHTLTKTIALDKACTEAGPGGSTSCDLDAITAFTIFSIGFPGLSIDLAYDIDPTVNATFGSFTTEREYKVVADSDIDDLTFAGSSLADPVQLECGAAGDDLFLNLRDSALAVDPSIAATLDLVLKVPIIGDVEVASAPLGSLDFPATSLTDAGVDGSSLGTIGLDKEPPIVALTDADAIYLGNEGSPIAMAATIDDSCGANDVVWSYSDGTKEYGPSVNKTFADDGPYSGNVTATDARWNKTVRNFTVNVANVAPAAYAGLDTTADWGRPVAFNGQATDPGAPDLVSLAYTWDFGDGTPSATGGKNALHSYSAPSAVGSPYVAKLTVTDNDSASNEDTRTVTVTRRDTTLVYTGALTSLPNKSATMSASLSDEYGQPVVGRAVVFKLNGVQVATAYTASNGVASASVKITQKVGTHTLDASFAQDTHYNAASVPTQTFRVKK